MGKGGRHKSRPSALLCAPRGITRRDFLNAALLGAGALLLDLPAPRHLLAQTGHPAQARRRQGQGYGGMGDYASSNGNTEEVVQYAHAMRDGRYDPAPKDIIETGETFDLVIIGGGMSGLGAAYHFKKTARRGLKCLVIENHPVFGGQSKRNEFIVEGTRLIGPQGANSFVIIEPEMRGHEIYSALGIPRDFAYRRPAAKASGLMFDRTNYGFMLWKDRAASVGYYFKGQSGPALDIWSSGLDGAPYPEPVKKDLLEWRRSEKKYYKGNNFERWLDTMTYAGYIEKVMGLSPEVSRFADPVLSSSVGLGADAVSAYAAFQTAMPGFRGFGSSPKESEWHSFPGGNDAFARCFVKRLIPGAIKGGNSFDEMHNRPIEFGALDQEENSVRIRLGALAVRVEHDAEPAEPERSGRVRIDYVKDGRVYRLRARGAVMANGSWVTKKIVKDLPLEYRDAYGEFCHSPMLVANVAVTNWRFLYKLGVTACRWFEGFGFACNIRQPMMVGDYRPPLDPEKPAIITLYVPFYYPGLPAKEQGIKGRTEMLSTSFARYEERILAQMTRLFGSSGFDRERDIAGIILNRWGHAYVNPIPGFYFGKDGSPAPRDVLRKPFGRIAFAHSELNGHQHWLGAVEEGLRAASQAMAAL